MDHGDAHERVLCFASAAEFGISMHHQSERCRAAATYTGSGAMSVLYWTAVRRMRSSWPSLQDDPHHEAKPGKSHVNEASRSSLKLPETVLCTRCEGLLVDPCNAKGHEAWHPVSKKYFLRVGSGMFAEAIEHRCQTCETSVG